MDVFKDALEGTPVTPGDKIRFSMPDGTVEWFVVLHDGEPPAKVVPQLAEYWEQEWRKQNGE